jgi:hypothetical protein
MPDTGAPWNIPYVENVDLVSDWPADSLLVANAVAAGLSAAGNPGIGSNVVQATAAAAFSTTSGTYTTVTGLTLSFTPTSDTSKVALFWTVPMASAGSGGANRRATMSVFRGGTNLIVPTSPSNRTASLVGINVGGLTYATMVLNLESGSLIDSPATTSAITYDVRVFANYGNTVFVNRSIDDSDTSDFSRAVSTLIAIEVAA